MFMAVPPEHARSRLISGAKQGRAWLVLGWEKVGLYVILQIKTKRKHYYLLSYMSQLSGFRD